MKLYVQVYQDVALEGAVLVTAFTGERSVEHWQSEQLNVVVDGRQSLLALLSPSLEIVHQAIWSNSLYLSSLLHSGLTSEHTIHRLLHARGERAMKQVLEEHRFFLHDELPGPRELRARFLPKQAPKKKKKKK